jgi:hypothetical protein
MSATIINFADYRAQTLRRTARQPAAVAQLTPLDILNRIADKLGLPPLEEEEGGGAR